MGGEYNVLTMKHLEK